jgi:hypothetical protein
MENSFPNALRMKTGERAQFAGIWKTDFRGSTRFPLEEPDKAWYDNKHNHPK